MRLPKEDKDECPVYKQAIQQAVSKIKNKAEMPNIKTRLRRFKMATVMAARNRFSKSLTKECSDYIPEEEIEFDCGAAVSDLIMDEYLAWQQ